MAICVICSNDHDKDFICDPGKRVCYHCNGMKHFLGETTMDTCGICRGFGWITLEAALEAEEVGIASTLEARHPNDYKYDER